MTLEKAKIKRREKRDRVKKQEKSEAEWNSRSTVQRMALQAHRLGQYN